MGADSETYSQTLSRGRAQIGDLHRVPPLKPGITPQKRMVKNCRSQSGEITRTQPQESTMWGSLDSQRLKLQSQRLHGSALGLLHMLWLLTWCFVWFWTVAVGHLWLFFLLFWQFFPTVLPCKSWITGFVPVFLHLVALCLIAIPGSPTLFGREREEQWI